MNNSLEFARTLDAADPLRAARSSFIIPVENGREQIYFLGNSLGLQPKRTASYIDKVMQQWSRHGVESFFMGDDPWINYHGHLVKPLSNILGTLPQEIVVMNQLTVNLHLMMVSFYRPEGQKRKIICEAKAFPSDQYMFESHLKALGLDPDDILIEVGPREGEHIIRNEDIISMIHQTGNDLALVLWGGINYYTGQLFDMASITDAAHSVGAKAGFDLAHAAGNVMLHLHQWNVDFACWCSYKYLNAGPGAVGAAYIHERYHNDQNIHRFAGWWGYEKETRFLMKKGFVPMRSAEGWQLSTPSPIMMASMRASLEIFEEAGFAAVYQKGQLLSDYLLFLLDDINKSSSSMIEVITPSSHNEKGCQISMLMHKNGKEIFGKLSREGVYADWREPNVIRVAPVPLYNKFEEVWHFAEILRSTI
ncbi:kynureninase [Flavihumibacter sp. ZG627]|uniref:kynureninase n=1 Tax=Flavihumibacter sp. ZG627 TaxID=1463156 RepID=UPI000A808A40|nr:kynureninase [Flavihumibacter sp. ZG627]